MPFQETHQQQLMDSLRAKLFTMAAKTQQAMDDAIIALMDRDVARAEEVIEGDAVLDAMEVELDDDIMHIMARAQPVAGDLRLLLSGVRLIVDLERIGDEAVNVARRSAMMQEFTDPQALPWLGTLGARARTTLREAVRAFREGDAELALRIRCQNDDITQLVVRGFQQIMQDLQKQNIDAWYALHLILVTRSLERVCNRAINVAEHAYFLAKGVNIKHMAVDDMCENYSTPDGEPSLP